VELSTIVKFEKGTEKRKQDKKRGEQKCSPPLKDVKFFLSFAQINASAKGGKLHISSPFIDNSFDRFLAELA
jgi:hypothetical protein